MPARKSEQKPASPSRTYGGQSSVEREQARRERLVRAGVDLFGTGGYANTPIERLCTLSGVTARHFYEIFPSREALLRAVYDDVTSGVYKRIVQALAAPAKDPMARIGSAIDAFVHAYLDDPRFARIAFLEVVGVSPDMERHRRSVIHNFAFVIQAQAEALAEEGRVPAGDQTLPAIALTGAVHELLVDWLTRPGKHPISKLTEVLVHLFRSVILGSQLVDAPPHRPPKATRNKRQ